MRSFSSLVLAALGFTAQISAAPQSVPRPKMVLQIGHGNQISHAALSPSGQTLATAGNDATVRLWNVRSGELHRIIESGYVSQVAWSRDGAQILTASNELRVWDARSGVLVRSVALSYGWSQGEFSPDARLFARPENDSRESRIVLWNTATGTAQRTLPPMPAESYTTALAWTRDSAFLAAINRTGKATIWRASDGKRASTVDFRSAARRTRSEKEGGGDYYVTAIAFSFDGKTLAAGGDDGIRLADWKARRVTRRFAPHSEYEETRALRFSADGTKLFSATVNDERIWNVRTGKFLGKLKGSDVAGFFNNAPQPNTFLVGGGNAPPGLWSDNSVAPLKLFSTTTTGSPGFNSARLSPDHRSMQLSSWQSGRALWDWQKLQRTSLAASGEWLSGKPALVLSANKNVLEWRRMPAGTLHKQFKVPNPPRKNSYDRELALLATSPDTRLIAVATNSELLLLDARTGAVRRRVPRPSGEIYRAEWSPDGTLLAMGGGEEHGSGDERGTFSIVDIKRNTVNTFAAYNGVQSFAWSGDSRTLAVGCGNEEGNDSWGEIQLWDARAGRLQRYLLGHKQPVTSLAWSGDTLLAASRDDLKSWPLPRESLAATSAILPNWTLPRGSSQIFVLPDTGNFLRCEAGGQIVVCRVLDGAVRATLLPLPSDAPHGTGLFKNWLLFTPEGFYTGSPGCEKWIRWRVGSRLLSAAAFTKQFNRIDKVRAALGASV
ncbi:MAG TPA: hypothetical protein VF681_15310 [Abditibacteriaceae bacterium]|jgi:WD40 repeat protein